MALVLVLGGVAVFVVLGAIIALILGDRLDRWRHRRRTEAERQCNIGDSGDAW